MILLRSALFNAAFYVSLLLVLLLGMPLLLLPRRVPLGVGKAWARAALAMMRVLVGIRTEFRGLERIPEGPLLVAAKHQSMWETFALLTLFDDPAFILKRELMMMPIFGWWTAGLRMIPVDRKARASALAVLRRARAEAATGRQILIFPEGTRRAPGDPPDYKTGAAALYGELGVTCLPVALNSGLFWPRRSFRRHPGTIVIEFLEPIPPGLPRRVFAARLEASIEAASDRLLLEAAQASPDLPLPEGVRERLGGGQARQVA